MGQAVAVHFGLEEPPDHVVTGVVERLPAVELRVEVRVHPLRLFLLVRERGFGRGAPRTDRRLLELLEKRNVTLGQAEDAEEDP